MERYAAQPMDERALSVSCYEFLMNFADGVSGDETCNDQVYQRYIAPVLQEIETRYGERLTVAELSAGVYVTQQYLTRLFRRFLGCSVYEYITSLRISKAKELLSNRRLEIQGDCPPGGLRGCKPFYGDVPKDDRDDAGGVSGDIINVRKRKGDKTNMKRNVSLEEISDGRLYSRNDMVRADCGGCKGAVTAARHGGIGDSRSVRCVAAVRWTWCAVCRFAGAEAGAARGGCIILPNIKMDPKTDACGFLNEEGRCSIHGFRPGVCRLFPLGRYYSEEAGKKEFHYFLQIHECPMPNKTKVKVNRWVGYAGPCTV